MVREKDDDVNVLKSKSQNTHRVHLDWIGTMLFMWPAYNNHHFDSTKYIPISVNFYISSYILYFTKVYNTLLPCACLYWLALLCSSNSNSIIFTTVNCWWFLKFKCTLPISTPTKYHRIFVQTREIEGIGYTAQSLKYIDTLWRIC